MRFTVLSAAILFLLASTASAATFKIDFSVNGTMGVIGTFDAPATGGPVSNLMVTLAGVTFDTQTGGGDFEYDPAINDFVNYSGFPGYTNSAPAAICAAGACALEIYPIPGGGMPGDYLAIDDSLANIDDGTKYLIDPTPVPLPASGVLLIAAVTAAGLLRRRAAT